MTNDGRVTDRLLSPKYVHEKEYTVKVDKPFSDTFIELMQNGVHFDGFISKKCKVWRQPKSKDIFHIVLTEGKKRQIRRMCEALHHNVINLKRIRILNIELEKIPLGEWRVIKGKELNWTYEHRYLKADGTYAFVSNKAVIIKDKDRVALSVIFCLLSV